jgi:hypothetical protein
MAAIRLNEGWTISCGVWPPLLMPSLSDVRGALRDQGLLRREPAAMDALYDRWTEAQAWVYALAFDCPGEDERAALRFEWLSGSGAVRLNGREIARFETGELLLDITGWVREEGNRLEVAFDPGLSPEVHRGILGPVWLRTTNYVELRRVRAEAAGGAIRVASDLVAHTAGRFLFRYQVSLEGEMVATGEFFERLRAAEARVEHEVKLPSSASWDGEQYYTVRLFVERSGVGCDSALINVAMDAKAPRFSALIPIGRLRDRELARLARKLGAEAAFADLPGQERALVPLDLLPEGLLLLERSEGEGCESEDALAMPVGEALEKLASGERFWPADAPVWRATGSPAPDREGAEALYGANALGDAMRYARISRLVQAEALRHRALEARRAERPLTLLLAENAPSLRSAALIEFSGALRPAYGAVRQAWAECAAFDLPEVFLARSPLPVRLYSTGRRRPATVTASVYALDGRLVASTSFACFAGADALLGELRFTLPPEGILIARAELKDDGGTRQVDQLILAAPDGAPPRGALLNPPQAELRVRDGFLHCSGSVAALGVWTGGFYGALLPGEKIPLPEGIAAARIESLNGQIL